jgi:hypothetical protein
MLVKFTNAAEEHKGNSIFINRDWVVAVFNAPSMPGGSLATIVYGGPQGTTWNVEESPEQVQMLLNASDKGNDNVQSRSKNKES